MFFGKPQPKILPVLENGNDSKSKRKTPADNINATNNNNMPKNIVAIAISSFRSFII